MKRIFYFLIAFVAIALSSCGDKKAAPADEGDKKAAPAPADEGYKVGDYYCDNVKEGIVFQVYDGGKHGKIISLRCSTAQWSERAVAERPTDATSDDNGMVNMEEIMDMPNWEANYPAFAACASMGDGWYLPASEEMELVFKNKDAINRTLAEKGHEKMSTFYWTSTDAEAGDAWGCDFSDDSWNPGSGYEYKHKHHTVRAVCRF